MLLDVENLCKRYGGVGRGAASEVLEGVTLHLDRGESLAIVGPSGSGKSTLLNVIGGLERATSGRVLLDGIDLARLDDAALARVRNQRLGFVFQRHHLLPQLTALENALVPALARSALKRAEGAQRAARLFERAGLGHRLDHRPGQLSGGERQRVAVVRALVNAPDLVLADEPTGSLDAHSAEALFDLLVELNRDDGVTLVVVTHAASLAARLGRVEELRNGLLREREGVR